MHNYIIILKDINNIYGYLIKFKLLIVKNKANVD